MMTSKQTLDQENFNKIRFILHDVAGITLSDSKIQMVENRINKRLKELSLQHYNDYIHHLKSNENTEIINLVNALTTNVTHFFRENHHFEHLRADQIHKLQSGHNKYRIWSAGCSIGAEPYSAAICVKKITDQLKTKPDIKILATDIDTVALNKARQGFFEPRYLKTLDKENKLNFFKYHQVKDQYEISKELRQLVFFNHFNLNTDTWPMSGPFDAIFCRNLLIYFQMDKQIEFVKKMTQRLRPGGFLYLGHSEHMVMNEMKFKTVGQTIYQKPE